MPDEVVIDASVIAKVFFFEEKGSHTARALLASRLFVSAPDLIFVEMASIAAKKVRRGLADHHLALAAVEAMVDAIDLVEPLGNLSVRAFQLAREHGFSAYDGAYLALAEERGAPVLTADEKLIRRAREAGLGAMVRPLISAA